MIGTPGQMRAAGLELRLRREGAVSQEASRAESTRPFGAARDETLQRVASGPTALEVADMARELKVRAAGDGKRLTKPTAARPFASLQTPTLRTHVRRNNP